MAIVNPQTILSWQANVCKYVLMYTYVCCKLSLQVAAFPGGAEQEWNQAGSSAQAVTGTHLIYVECTQMHAKQWVAQLP